MRQQRSAAQRGTHNEEQLDEEADEAHEEEAPGGDGAHLEVLCARVGRSVAAAAWGGVGARRGSKFACMHACTLARTRTHTCLSSRLTEPREQWSGTCPLMPRAKHPARTRTPLVRLGAPLHQARAVLGEVAQGLPRQLPHVHGGLRCCFWGGGRGSSSFGMLCPNWLGSLHLYSLSTMRQPTPGWALHPGHVVLLPPGTAHALYAPTSLPLHMPEGAAGRGVQQPAAQEEAAEGEGGQQQQQQQHERQGAEEGAGRRRERPGRTLQLFGAAVLESAVVAGAGAGGAAGSPQGQEEGRQDAADGAGPAAGRKRARQQGEAAQQEQQQQQEEGDRGGGDEQAVGTQGQGVHQEQEQQQPQQPQQQPQQQLHAACDVVLSTGGLVWSSAFCPHIDRRHAPLHPEQQPEQEPEQQQQQRGKGRKRGPTQQQQQQQEQQQQQQQQQQEQQQQPSQQGACSARRGELLAVSVHPAGVTRTKQGAVQEGQGGIQVRAASALPLWGGGG